MLADARPESEIAGKKTDHKRPEHVHDQGSEWELVSQDAYGRDIDPVTKGSANSGPEEDDQVQHGKRLLPPEQFFDLAVPELYPGRATVIALARTRGHLHLAQKCVHLGN